MKFINKYFKRKVNPTNPIEENLDREWFFGEYKILLKNFHRLDEFQMKYPLYDQFLPFFCKDFKGLIIDIGANIGDTTIGIFSKNKSSFIVSVEPDEAFFNDCRLNIVNNGLIERSLVINKFISTEKGSFVVVKNTSFSTGSIQEAKNDSKGTSTLSFVELMNLIPVDKKSRFDVLKIDTDSFDWDIIQSFVIYAKENLVKPRFIFFEMQTFKNDNEFTFESRDEIIFNYQQALVEIKNIGYTKFSLFDNFGTYFKTSESIEEIVALAHYIRRSQTFNKHSTIYYFDILAYSESESKFVENCLDKLY